MLSVRPSCELPAVFSTRGKGALGPLLSAPAGASKRETPTSNHTESSEVIKRVGNIADIGHK